MKQLQTYTSELTYGIEFNEMVHTILGIGPAKLIFSRLRFSDVLVEMVWGGLGI